MADLVITPPTVRLTSGQAATFTATLDGNPVEVKWGLSQGIGNFRNPSTGTMDSGITGNSAVYVATPLVFSTQTLVVIATVAATNESATATICLTPDAVVVVPPKVDLKFGQSQQFAAIVAGTIPSAGSPEVDWTLSPQIGILNETGLYEANEPVTDSGTITIVATTRGCGKQASATINLIAPPWKGRGVNLLGVYLLLVFSLVYLMIGLWPPSQPVTPEEAATDRRAAETVLQGKSDSLKAEEDAAKQSPEQSTKNPTAGAAASTDSTKAPGPKPDADKDSAAKSALARAQDDVVRASVDLDLKRSLEHMVTDPYVHTLLFKSINRDIDLLLLVLLGGALGSFLHTARSYSEFIGNRTIKSSWVWWYCLHPFIGAGLALVFYAAARGGFIAISSASNIKASDLNPFGVVSLAALVGMFSKAATTKLGELFDTAFQTAKAGESKDKLINTSSSSPPGASAPSTSSGGAGAPVPGKPAATWR